MDPRRNSRLNDPKVRQVGFFAHGGLPLPHQLPYRTQSDPPVPLSSAPPPVSDVSPSGNSISPVMIPPPDHASDNLSAALETSNQQTKSLRNTVALPMPETSALRRHSDDSNAASGSNSLSGSPFGASPSSWSSRMDDGEFSQDSANWIIKRSKSGKLASSLPTSGFESSAAPGIDKFQEAPVSKEKGHVEQSIGTNLVSSNEFPSSSEPVKKKTTKAERRALQESQRAAKATAKDSKRTPPIPRETSEQVGKTAKPLHSSQKQDCPPVTSGITEKKTNEKTTEKDKKKDVPPPRMQFDDQNRVEKAKKNAVVKKTESKNRVELFRHLPQYEHGTQFHDLVVKFFQFDPVHPSVYEVGLKYLAGDIVGSNARCVAMLNSFSEAIRDYSTPPEKILVRDLTAKINSYISFFIECRPLSISMGNAIRFLKGRIAKLPFNLSESEAKNILCSDIKRFMNEKIVLADKVIVEYAVTKIRDGDVILTYGSSTVVEMILLYAHELGRNFRVVVVDSRPRHGGRELMHRLVLKGLLCTYTCINAVSHIMHEITKVFLGAASVLSNGTIYSGVGTACVAMVAHAFDVRVLVCCEAYKFVERVQLDSICYNELGDPDVISKVPGRRDVNFLDGWANKQNLQLLNLLYDATPSDYISMIITEYGMVPPTSVPVIVREYGREHLLI
ncbi:translation initiation factor eIF-2B subunit delta-like [Impatiens glandulifera]|uniref:translation initiation factor eIF-2B subunit delta-like n=1 Tax=Impatiens glandulifera TaxID=253017 RepID=UPI001FB0D698|nr:translation initiation factor eIF-2B subunit delta-like [Impatiens glandulifera]